uniref:MFS transporter n=1 Tax=OCS116 cluster bacterium TaxID=2030921 RepID=A0A2A4Z7K9_9PROT
MDLSIILSFAFMASLLVISPGPNGLLIAKTALLGEQKYGFANVAGIGTGMYLHGTMVVFGLAVLLVKSIFWFTVVKYIGAAYLIWVGLKTLYELWQNKTSHQKIETGRKSMTLKRAYIDGVLTNLLNPKTSMFYVAVLPQLLPIELISAQNVYALVSLHVVLNALWFCGMILLFARMKKLSSSGRVQRWVKGVTGVVFIGFGAKLATLNN